MLSSNLAAFLPAGAMLVHARPCPCQAARLRKIVSQRNRGPDRMTDGCHFEDLAIIKLSQAWATA